MPANRSRTAGHEADQTPSESLPKASQFAVDVLTDFAQTAAESL